MYCVEKWTDLSGRMKKLLKRRPVNVQMTNDGNCAKTAFFNNSLKTI